MSRIVSIIVLLLAATPAWAVSCGGRQSVRQAYSSAEHVFSAHVERFHVAPGFGRDDFRFAELRILRVWKGSLIPGDVVQATAEDSIRFVSDGFVPPEGSDVLVYSDGSRPLVLRACSRTAPLKGTRDIGTLERLSRRSHGR